MMRVHPSVKFAFYLMSALPACIMHHASFRIGSSLLPVVTDYRSQSITVYLIMILHSVRSVTRSEMTASTAGPSYESGNIAQIAAH